MSPPKDYPVDWPRCPVCDDFALDGHITCGRAECDEGGARRRRRGDPDPNYDTLEEKRMDLPPKSYCVSIILVATALVLAIAVTLGGIAARISVAVL